MSDSTGVDDRRKLQRAIARKASEIRALGRRRRTAEAELRRLEAKLAAFDDHGSTVGSDAPSAKDGVPRTSSEKIALFRSLFRGREDVLPLLWTNRRTGRQGYAPACGNEWVRGVCEKPEVRCGECPNQAFLTVTDRVIRDHLQGRHVAGVYPLLADDTCWFLAVDFDKGDWKGDVSAFRSSLACTSAALPDTGLSVTNPASRWKRLRPDYVSTAPYRLISSTTMPSSTAPATATSSRSNISTSDSSPPTRNWA